MVMRKSHRALAVLLVASGCSGGPGTAAAPPYDSGKARDALVASLDAWKKGQTKTLAKRRPPIRFEDDDLVRGLRLFDYEIEEPDSPITLHQNVGVILSLRDARGNAVRREATYQVATEPALAVLRSDR
jgi:hypothetical protein